MFNFKNTTDLGVKPTTIFFALGTFQFGLPFQNLGIVAAVMVALGLLIISLADAVHAVVLLAALFALGSGILIYLQIAYFGLLFLIVYLGAIVVLFLFIVMMIELKGNSTATSLFSSVLSVPTLITGFLLIELLLTFGGASPLGGLTIRLIRESNFYVNVAGLIAPGDSLRALGSVLYIQYGSVFVLSAFLLLLSMVGAIALTLDIATLGRVKGQDANSAALRKVVSL